MPTVLAFEVLGHCTRRACCMQKRLRRTGGRILLLGKISREAMRAGLRPKLRQCVDVPVFPRKKPFPSGLIHRLLLVKRLLISREGNDLQQQSGRRDSNPRQPAWKAGTYKITACFM